MKTLVRSRRYAKVFVFFDELVDAVYLRRLLAVKFLQLEESMSFGAGMPPFTYNTRITVDGNGLWIQITDIYPILHCGACHYGSTANPCQCAYDAIPELEKLSRGEPIVRLASMERQR